MEVKRDGETVEECRRREKGGWVRHPKNESQRRGEKPRQREHVVMGQFFISGVDRHGVGFLGNLGVG